MDHALAEKGYGNVKVSDAKMTYVMRDANLVLYTDESFLPSGTAFQPMRVRQFYETVLADEQAQGIIVNPDVAGHTSYVIPRSDIPAALPKLPAKDPLPSNINIRT